MANFRPPCNIYDQQSFISVRSIGGCFGHIGGSANRPTIDQFEHFSTFSYTKAKFKGGQFYEKNCQLMYLRPHFAGCFEKRGVC